jgi:uncharacterized protein YbbK (DUF523 family)
MPPVRLLASACLLGGNVRYDGGNRLEPALAEAAVRGVEWVPVCPEVECGLPVPRPPMRLSGDPASPRLVETEGGADHTARMEAFVARKLRELEEGGLSGYVCKSGSPSCGLEGVVVFDAATGEPAGTGAGLFTRAFRARFPAVPVAESGWPPGRPPGFIPG